MMKQHDLEQSTYYREIQRFRQPWLWTIIGGFLLFVCYTFVRQIVLGHRIDAQAATDSEVIFLTGLGVCTALMIAVIKLVVVVRSDGIRITFFPFYTRHIPAKKIKESEVLNHQITPYAADRVHRAEIDHKVYSVDGSEAVKIELDNGKTIVIGSQRAHDLYSNIQKIANGCESVSTSNHQKEGNWRSMEAAGKSQ